VPLWRPGSSPGGGTTTKVGEILRKGTVFTFFPENDAPWTLDTYALRQHLQEINHKIDSVVIDYDHVKKLILDKTVEISRIRSIMERNCFDDDYDPIIIIDYDDNTNIIVSGNHRYVARALHSDYETIKAYVVPKEIWKGFLIDIIVSKQQLFGDE
jgi:hypothetical protein